MFKEINPSCINKFVEQGFTHEFALEMVQGYLDTIDDSITAYFDDTNPDSKTATYSANLQMAFAAVSSLEIPIPQLIDEMRQYAADNNLSFEDYRPHIEQQISIYEEYQRMGERLGQNVQRNISEYVRDHSAMKVAGKLPINIDVHYSLTDALGIDDPRFIHLAVDNALKADEQTAGLQEKTVEVADKNNEDMIAKSIDEFIATLLDNNPDVATQLNILSELLDENASSHLQFEELLVRMEPSAIQRGIDWKIVKPVIERLIDMAADLRWSAHSAQRGLDSLFYDTIRNVLGYKSLPPNFDLLTYLYKCFPDVASNVVELKMQENLDILSSRKFTR